MATNMVESTEEIVPGMADAIEARRREMGLSPGDFAERAGLTRQGLAPVRKGYRRGYQDRVKLGVARALQWPPDAVDRLMAGEDPTTWGRPEAADEDRIAAIERGLRQLNDGVAELLRRLPGGDGTHRDRPAPPPARPRAD